MCSTMVISTLSIHLRSSLLNVCVCDIQVNEKSGYMACLASGCRPSVVRHHPDNEAGMLLLSSNFLHCLPTPTVSVSTSVADARHWWFGWRVCLHLRFSLLNGKYDDEVIPLSPTLLVFLCMVAVYGDPLCILAKDKELVRDSIRNNSRKILW
jgi:hypothetical protein